MRPQVVAITLLLAVGIGGAAWFLSRASRSILPTPPAPVATPAQTGTAEATTGMVASTPAPAMASVPATTPLPSSATENVVATPAPATEPATNHDLYVFDRNAELLKLAREGGTDALNAIWSEMSNPDKEIRAGALDALVQLGDKSVSPRLRELAAQTEDAREKLDILAAADQLELPPLGSTPIKPPTNQSY